MLLLMLPVGATVAAALAIDIVHGAEEEEALTVGERYAGCVDKSELAEEVVVAELLRSSASATISS